MDKELKENFAALLSDLGRSPVLLDIGASGTPPAIWDNIATFAIYIGFDPDLRAISEVTDGKYSKSIIVNEAVTDKSQAEVEFFLTKSPYCSSVLEPNQEAVEDYLFADLFTVERKARVKATTLNAIIEQFKLSNVDWIKLDTQGTDLRLFQSISDNIRSKILAIDIEPGWMNAYHDEDDFVNVHQRLDEEGFWLSYMEVKGAVRMRAATYSAIKEASGLDENLINYSIRQTPGWVEARYLKTLPALARSQAERADYYLLWIFALIDGQFGFALDIAQQYKQLFGKDTTGDKLTSLPLQLIEQVIRKKKRTNLLSRGIGRIKRLMK